MLKIYPSPPQSVCLLKGNNGIAIVEYYRDSGPKNAAILNCDGAERLRLSLPMSENLVYGYDSIYYVGGSLVAILAATSGDFAVVVDPETGMLSGIKETR